jgi:hypothetical protein
MMFDQEKRIKILEKKVEDLTELVKDLTSQQTKWLTLTEAYNKFGISKSVIRKRIIDGILIHSKDWKKNGRNYLINPKAIKKIS